MIRINQLAEAAASAASRHKNQPRQLVSFKFIAFRQRRIPDNFAGAQDVHEVIIQIDKRFV